MWGKGHYHTLLEGEVNHYSCRKESGKIHKVSASTELCPRHQSPLTESVLFDEKRQHPKIHEQADFWAKRDKTNKKPEKNWETMHRGRSECIRRHHGVQSRMAIKKIRQGSIFSFFPLDRYVAFFTWQHTNTPCPLFAVCLIVSRELGRLDFHW